MIRMIQRMLTRVTPFLEVEALDSTSAVIPNGAVGSRGQIPRPREA
jgi:hypothetical protein